MGRRSMTLPVSVVALMAVVALMGLLEGRRANNRLDRRDRDDKEANRIMVQDMIDDLEYWANNDHPSGDDW
jgi:succinate dehydrogenase/fumarate reductase flavoprotein subunit